MGIRDADRRPPTWMDLHALPLLLALFLLAVVLTAVLAAASTIGL